jgi:ACS family hexuronate transporter-like MFS transporter
MLLVGLLAGLWLTVKRLRWRICVILCAAITISYLDRQTLSLAINEISRSGQIELHDGDFAKLNTCFLFAYALMYVGGGQLMDRLGIRRGFLAIMIVWSLAVMSHGLVSSFAGLAVCRVLLGIGEGGGFPAVTKAVGEWFPARERSTAIGIANAGTALGGMIAPPLAALVISTHAWPSLGYDLSDSWRWVFLLFGASGLVWCSWWWWMYYPAKEHPRLTPSEREEIGELLVSPVPNDAVQTQIPWRTLLTMRTVWGLMLCKFLGDAVWYFIAFWLPKYLMDVRGFDIKAVGQFAWLPWLGAGLGCVLIGQLSSWLIRRGMSIHASRLLALAMSVAVMPCLYWAPKIEDNSQVIYIFVLAYFGQQAWSTIVMTLPTDLFPRGNVGSVAGLVGFAGAMGGIVFGELAGRYLATHKHDYAPIFLVASTLHVLSFFVILIAVSGRSRNAAVTSRED